MRKPIHSFVLANVAAGLLVAGCGGSNADMQPTTPTSTTSAALPTANDQPTMPPSTMGSPNNPSELPTTPATTPAPPSTPPMETTLNDAQIAGIAQRIDLAEIDAAKVALSHAKSPKVKEFAQHMISAHSALEAKLGAMMKTEKIVPSESVTSEKLTADTNEQKQALMGQSGVDFDRAYMAAQLKDHQDALDLMDNKLIPDAADPQLKAALEQTRAKVVLHIQMAKDTLAALPSP